MQDGYYANLLIKQYRDKPKARGMIESLVKLMPIQALEQMNRAYSIDEAVGPQLTILARWVGVNRNLPSTHIGLNTYFAMPQIEGDTIESVDILQAGFQRFNDPQPGDGPFLTIADLFTEDNKISDDDLRILIKLKIIKNNVRATQGKIDRALYETFGSDVYATWPRPKTMVYNCTSAYRAALVLGRSADWLPRPTDCKIIINEV